MKSVKQSLFLVLSFLLSSAAFSQLNNVSVTGTFQMYGGGGVYYNYPFRINDGQIDGGRFYVGTNTNIGIGVNTPNEKLHLKGGNFKIESNNATGPNVSTIMGIQTLSGSQYGYVGTQTNTPLGIGINNNVSSPSMYFATNGRIGINNSDPDYDLDLFGETGGRYVISENGPQTPLINTVIGKSTVLNVVGAYVGTQTQHPLRLGANSLTTITLGTDGSTGIGGAFKMGAVGTFDIDNETLAGGRFRIIPNGNVGININNPLEKLHLNGNFRMGSGYTVAMDAPGVVGGRFLINAAGNVGIGTNIPVEKLHLNGNFRMGGDYTFGVDAVGTVGGRFFVNAAGNVGIGVNPATDLTAKLAIGLGNDASNVPIYAHINETSGDNGVYIGTSSNHLVALGTNGASRIVITKDGNVGIGTSDPGTFQLAVQGKLGAQSIEVRTGSWADFVFDKNYKLRSLKEVEDSININKHLPDVPSEERVKRDGINVAKMDAILLQKIEELTLYVIEQNKRIEAIEKENTRLKKKANRQ